MTLKQALSKSNPLLALATIVLVIAGVQLNWWERCAAWHAAQDLPLLRAQCCGPYQAPYDTWKRTTADKSAVEAVNRSIELIDALTAQLVEGINELKEHAAGKPPLSCAGVVAKHEGLLTLQGVLETLPPDQYRLVHDYCRAYARASEQFILGQGRLVAASGAPLAPLAEMCGVLPLLGRTQDDWTNCVLPPWLDNNTCRSALEYLALRTGHPLAAYRFSLEFVEPPTAQDLINYVGPCADRLIKGRYFTAAETCLRLGIDQARRAQLTGSIPSLEVALIETLHQSNQENEALCEVRAAIDQYRSTASFPSLVIQEMCVLSDMKQIDQVIDRAQRYRDDPRFAAVLPQLLYVAWAASRHEKATASNAAEFWRGQFQKQFPTHALGAEMYFVAATDALASGDFTQASADLEFIKVHYPGSGTAAKAATLQRRMPEDRH